MQEKKPISERIKYIIDEVGVPACHLMKFLKVCQPMSSLLCTPYYDTRPDSPVVKRVEKALDELEPRLKYLDECYYRPRTWTQAINLCMKHKAS